VSGYWPSSIQAHGDSATNPTRWMWRGRERRLYWWLAIANIISLFYDDFIEKEWKKVKGAYILLQWRNSKSGPGGSIFQKFFKSL
jgi:hypothetical protein